MGTVCQLLALPACFLLVGVLRGDCRSLVLSFLRRVGKLMGTDDRARAVRERSGARRRRVARVGFGRALVYCGCGAPVWRAAPRKPAMRR